MPISSFFPMQKEEKKIWLKRFCLCLFVFVCRPLDLKANRYSKRTNKSCHLCSSPSDRVNYVCFCPCVQHHPCDISLSCRHKRRKVTTLNKETTDSSVMLLERLKPTCTHRFYLTGQQTSALCIHAHAHYNSHLHRVEATTCTCLLFPCKRRAWEESSHTVDKTKKLRKAADIYCI